MSRPADVVSLGVLPLQHHEPGFDIDMRWLVAGWRVVKAPGSDGPLKPAEESVGDILGATLWVRDRGVRGADARPIPGWSFAWPAVVTRAPKATAVPTGTATREDIAAAEAAGRNGVRPIGDKDQAPDPRFKEMPAAAPEWASKHPKGWTGVVGSASNETKQIETFHPDALGLVAPHAGGSPIVGTAVVDTQADGTVDPDRRALLQKLIRVVKRPASGLVALGENALAWQLGVDRLGKTGGFGLVADERPRQRVETPGGTTTTTTPGGKQRERVETPGGVPSSERSKSLAPSTSLREPATPAPAGGGASVLACAGASAGGPLDVGSPTDIHQIGTDADGAPINACHLSTSVLLTGPQGDAGIAIEGGPFPDVASGPYTVAAHMRFNPRARHEWAGGVGPGRFEFFAEVPIGIVPPPPRDPPFPPEGPRPPTPPPTTPRTPPTPPPPGPRPPRPPVPPGPGPEYPGGDYFPPLGPPIPEPGRDYDPVRPKREPDEWRPRLPFDPFDDPLKPGPQKGHRWGPPPLPFTKRYILATGTRREDVNRPIASGSMELAVPGLVIRPQHFGCGQRDFRNDATPPARALARRDRETPAIARIEGAFVRPEPTCNSGPPTYTQAPGIGRYPGGTASGTVADFPPEVGFEDAVVSYSPGFALSTLYRVGLAGQVHYGTGLPDVMGGAPKSGQMWGQAAAGGPMLFRSTTAAGAVSKTRTLPEEDGTIALVETSPLMGIRFSNAGAALRTFSVVDVTMNELASVFYTICYDLATTGTLTGYTIEDRVGTYEIDCASFTLGELADLIATVVDFYQSDGFFEVTDYGITNRRTRFGLDLGSFTLNQLCYAVAAWLTALGV